MPSVEKRVALLEGRIQEQAAFVADLRVIWGDVRESVKDLREQMERRFEQVDRRFEQVDRRFDFAQEQIDRRFDRVERHFAWLVGIIVTGFVTIIGALVGVVYR